MSDCKQCAYYLEEDWDGEDNCLNPENRDRNGNLRRATNTSDRCPDFEFKYRDGYFECPYCGSMARVYASKTIGAIADCPNCDILAQDTCTDHLLERIRWGGI